MLSPSEKEALDKGMIVLWIIWGAILISLFVYVLVCHLAGDQIRQNLNPDMPLTLFKNILYAASVLTLLISYFVRKAVLSVRSSSTRTRSSNISQQPAQPAFMGKYTVAMIVSLALSESIGIYGVVLFFMGDSLQTLYTFIGVSAMAMILYRPKKEEIITLANEMKMNLPHTTGL